MGSQQAAFTGLREVRPGRQLHLRFLPGDPTGLLAARDLGVLLVHGNQGSHKQVLQS